MPTVTTGSTITFGTSSWTGNVTSLSHSGMSRAVIDTTHLGTTSARTKIPGELVDGGTVEVGYQCDGGASTAWPPIAGAAETVTIKLGASGGPSVAFSGFVSENNFDISGDEVLITGTFTITVAGAVTYGAAS